LNYSLTHSWSTGFQVEGKPWGREKDILAFAVGQAIPSKDYKKYGTQISDLKAKPEGHLEAYYNIHINDHLSISPDFQYIWNPFGRDIADDTSGIFVGGMRAQVDF
jgi:carbohydrate-selective porin OprB